LRYRLEDVGGVRAASREIPLAIETREKQLRLVAGEISYNSMAAAGRARSETKQFDE